MEKNRNGIKTSKVSAFESTRKMQEKNLLRNSKPVKVSKPIKKIILLLTKRQENR